MKTSTLITLAIVLAIGTTALAQEKKAPTESQATVFTAKPLTVSGKVSADGKAFWTDLDSEWSVINAETLKGLEGRFVRIKCFVNSESNSIKVLWVKKDSGQSSYAARNTDSAFRR